MPVIGERPICLSGGAEGADQQWGMTAGRAGHTVFHFSFRGHRPRVPPGEVVTLSDAQLLEADPYLLRANATLRRTFPPKNPYAASLLRRNWYQVRDAQAVYAVATLGKDGLVSGGTAWAVQMFLDRHEGGACAAHLFDQATGRWHVWGEAGWRVVDAVPPPEGVWAGIGSRDLRDDGKAAIRALMGYAAITPCG